MIRRSYTVTRFVCFSDTGIIRLCVPLQLLFILFIHFYIPDYDYSYPWCSLLHRVPSEVTLSLKTYLWTFFSSLYIDIFCRRKSITIFHLSNFALSICGSLVLTILIVFTFLSVERYMFQLLRYIVSSLSFKFRMVYLKQILFLRLQSDDSFHL